MYSANLSWAPLSEILGALDEQGLVIKEIKRKHTTYKISKKGKNVLDYLSQALGFIEISPGKS